MPSVKLRAHTDAWVDHDAPNANHGAGAKIRVRGDATGKERRGLVFFRAPFTHGATIGAATLRLYAKNGWGAGARELKAKRIQDGWKENRVTWANQPDATATNEATENVSNLADGEEVAFDVTDQMADHADGDPFHGFRVVMDADEPRAFYSSDSPRENLRPTLEVEWGSAPYPPSNLHPGSGDAISVPGPRLNWRFTDNRGDTDQGWSQVQISATNNFTGALEYDSAKQANTRHSWALAGEYVVPDGATRWWRVRVWDETNLVSGWSDPVQFRRVSKGVLTILNPPAPPANIVDETTPPLSWGFTGVQKRVRVRVLELFANGKTRELFDWGPRRTDLTSITLPRGVVKTGKTFRFQLFVWDDEDRDAIPGDHDYVFAQRDFTYVRDGTPDPVETLDATLFGPGVILDFTRTLEPDFFCLVVDGVEVDDRIDPDDVRTGPGTYSLTYWRLLPRVAHTIELEAVVTVGGKRVHSSGNDFAVKTTDPDGIWIVDEDESQAVYVMGQEDADVTIGEEGTTYRPLGSRRKIRITSAIGGYEGSFSGVVFGEDARDSFLDLKGRPFAPLRLIAANLNVPVELEEITVAPTPSPSDPDQYRIGFGFFQSDEFFPLASEDE